MARRSARYGNRGRRRRDFEELMAERGWAEDHTTIWRWVQRYGPETHRWLRGNLKPKSSTWHLDENLRSDCRALAVPVPCSRRPWADRGFLSFADARPGSRQMFLEEGIGESRQPSAVRLRSGWSAQLSSSDLRTAA